MRLGPHGCTIRWNRQHEHVFDVASGYPTAKASERNDLALLGKNFIFTFVADWPTFWFLFIFLFSLLL
jgi:hypothetical protein